MRPGWSAGRASPPVDSPVGTRDASDATVPDADSGHLIGDGASADSGGAHDAGDTGIPDAHKDGAG